jgi:hypothetical protein
MFWKIEVAKTWQHFGLLFEKTFFNVLPKWLVDDIFGFKRGLDVEAFDLPTTL